MDLEKFLTPLSTIFTKVDITGANWGDVIILSNKESSICLHYYHDDPTIIYLSGLKVNSKFRNQGKACLLLDLIEEHCKQIGMVNSCILWVLENSWMHEWYKRKGYEELKPYKRDNYIWMEKLL